MSLSCSILFSCRVISEYISTMIFLEKYFFRLKKRDNVFFQQ